MKALDVAHKACPKHRNHAIHKVCGNSCYCQKHLHRTVTGMSSVDIWQTLVETCNVMRVCITCGSASHPGTALRRGSQHPSRAEIPPKHWPCPQNTGAAGASGQAGMPHGLCAPPVSRTPMTMLTGKLTDRKGGLPRYLGSGRLCLLCMTAASQELFQKQLLAVGINRPQT